ncbi:18112_t:CDS:2, partial [Dentiscutata erythropus]
MSIGIDLGSTYSCMGIWKVDHTQIITNDSDNLITPSYVAFTNHGRLVGDSAKNQISRNPCNTFYSSKKFVGCNFNDQTDLIMNLRRWPFNIVDRNNMPYFKTEEMGATKYFTPEAICSMILSKLKEDAENFTGVQIDNAVIAPAYYSLVQRQAIKNAAYAVGLNTLRLISDTSASVITYILSHKSTDECNILTIDLGSEILGVSLTTLEDSVIEVKAEACDPILGGNYFDQRIVNYFVQEFKSKFKKDLTLDARAMCRLRVACERAKCTLSVSNSANIEIDALFDNIDFYTRLTRTKFEMLNQDLFRSILEPIERVLGNGKIDKTQVHEIILTGGSTRIPMVQKVISDFFNGKPLNKSINPNESVAYGAAAFAAKLSGNVSGKLDEFLLLNTIYSSLGIETDGWVMTPLIKRNTSVPTKIREIFSTYYDNQPALFIKVYEGDRASTEDNTLLGKFILTGIPPAPRGTPQIEVTFDIDNSLFLNVYAVDKTTGQFNKISINSDRNNKEQTLPDEIQGWPLDRLIVSKDPPPSKETPSKETPSKETPSKDPSSKDPPSKDSEDSPPNCAPRFTPEDDSSPYSQSQTFQETAQNDMKKRQLLMEESYEIPSSSFSTEEYSNNSTFTTHSESNAKIEDQNAIIDRAKELMKDFSEPSNLIGFKLLVEDPEVKFPADLLIDALLLLGNASSFECSIGNTIPHLELRLRTWTTVLETAFYYPIVLNREIREKLYNNLNSFIDIHYQISKTFSQGNDHSKEIDNTNDNVTNFPNYNINFLLLHLRDTLHIMRDDETYFDEFSRYVNRGLLTFIRAIPKKSNGFRNIPVTLGELFVSGTIPRFSDVLRIKYPVGYWYPIWRELLFVHYSLKILSQDRNYNIIQFYNETYILESLWQHVFNEDYKQSTHVDIFTILNDQNEFSNLWTSEESFTLSNMLWFGILDLAQILSYKTIQPTSLALCYYLGLESLRKSQGCFIQFKSLELLLSLSYREPDWFEDMVQREIEKFIEALPKDAQNDFNNLIHDVKKKLQLENEIIGKLNTINSKKKPVTKKNSSDEDLNFLLEMIAENFTCPITGQITGDFLVLSCCGHSVSYYAIDEWKKMSVLEGKLLFECPFCRTEIKEESLYNLIQDAMIKCLHERLKRAGCLSNLETREISTNKNYLTDMFLKMDKMHIFRIHLSLKSPVSILRKTCPKGLHPAFNKAAEAEYQEDYTTAMVWLTQVLQYYPKSYSVQCRRAFAFWKLGLYLQALKDLAIKNKLLCVLIHNILALPESYIKRDI